MSIIELPGKTTIWKREISNRDESDHFVYVIANLSSGFEVVGPVKVGISNNPLARMQSIQTGSASRLVLVSRYAFWKRAHAQRVERCFHETCQVYRLEGEWFDINPDAAVALMEANARSFVADFLQPDDTGDWYFALNHIGLASHTYDLTDQDFRYRK